MSAALAFAPALDPTPPPPGPAVRSLVTWRAVETAQEYDAVVRLRVLAYARAGKIAPGDESAMRDRFDHGALILAAWYQGHPVSSLRILAHAPGEPWEHDAQGSLNAPDLPRRADTAEITRVCTHPAWRTTDVTVGLFQETALEVLRLGRRYLLGSATPGLLPLYTRIGCRPTSVRFPFAALGGAEHVVFTADVGGVLSAVRGAPWAALSLVWGDVIPRAVAEGLLPRPSGLAAVRLAVLRWLRPLVALLAARSARGTRRGAR